MPRVRSQKNRDLPPNLYVRNGYYSYRDPRTRKEYSLGRKKAYAINEAVSANQLLLNHEVSKPLTERIEGHGSVSFHEFLDRYEAILQTRGLREKTLKDYKSNLSSIKKGFIDAPIENILTKDIASFIQSYIMNNKLSTAKQLRSTLNDIFKESIYLGIIVSNPVTQTKIPKVKVQRSRLSINEFNIILSLIDKKYKWLEKVMKLALVTGQRVSDIIKMKWSDINNNKIFIIQQKTETKIAIPLDIEISGINLTEIIRKTKNDSDFIVTINNNKLSVEKISKAFARFRDKTNLTWEGNPPSFHEIRSLSARLYTEKMGSDFAQKLLGHKSSEMTAKYQDDRSNGWIEL